MPVNELWGFYDYKRGGVLTSIAVHVFIGSPRLGSFPDGGLIYGGSGDRAANLSGGAQNAQRSENVALLA